MAVSRALIIILLRNRDVRPQKLDTTVQIYLRTDCLAAFAKGLETEIVQQLSRIGLFGTDS